MNYSIESKIKKAGNNIYQISYLPMIEITNLETNKKSSYTFGDVYSSNGEFYFVNIDNNTGNFIGVYVFNFSEVRDYYKKSKTIDFLDGKTYIGNWFEFNKSMQRFISYKIFYYKDNLITDFDKELNEIIENVLSIYFTLKNELEVSTIKDLNDSFFDDDYLDVQFVINLNYAYKERNKKYFVPLESLYKDYQNNFFFYVNLSELGIIQVYLGNMNQLNYDEFISFLLMMHNEKFSKIKKNYCQNNISNKYINTLDYIYLYDEIKKVTCV